MCRLVHIHPMVMFLFFHRFYPPHLETFSGSAIISDQLKRRLQNTVLGLSEHNYPMLNDIKLPLCYKMLQKPGPSIIVSCNPCLGFLPLFLLPRSLLSRPLAKVHFNQIEPREFSAHKICILQFLLFCSAGMVGWLAGCDIPPKIAKLLFGAGEINFIPVWLWSFWRLYRVISK